MNFGKPRRDYDVVGSTQDVARDWALDGAPPGAIVTARGMTAGRGRLGRVWHVPPGSNVCCTLVGPPVSMAVAWQIALVVGCAVSAALRTFLEPLPDVAVPLARFPNDVFLAGRKVCGVLVETVAAPKRPGDVIPLIGIGVNVQQADTPFPPEIANIAISLEAACGVRFTVAEVEAAILAHLDSAWEEWETKGYAATIERWKSLTDPALPRNFILNDETVTCRVVELTPDGTVTIETLAGERYTLAGAQVILGD
jgi:BirA family biotin operon repressor/biotin-[acetyl-CoA-carboxylase] ligase